MQSGPAMASTPQQSPVTTREAVVAQPVAGSVMVSITVPGSVAQVMLTLPWLVGPETAPPETDQE